MLEKYLIKLHWFLKFLLCLGVFVTVWLIIGYLVPKILPTQNVSNKDLSGIIITSQRWSEEIRVVGDIWALPGTTITIAPGTKITVRKFGDKFNLHYLPWGLKAGLNTGQGRFGVKNGEYFWDEGNKIQIRLGKLVAIGTRDQPIVLSSEKSDGGDSDFNIFSFSNGIVSFLKASNYRQMLVGKDTVVRDSEFNNTAECAICLYHVNSTVVNNVFGDSKRQSVLVTGGSPSITNNLFQNRIGPGLIIDPAKISQFEVKNNDFEEDHQVALEILTGDEVKEGVISNNNFSGSSQILLPCNSHQNISQNYIRGFVNLTNTSRCIGSINLRDNFWNTTDSKVVLKEKVLGKPESFQVLIAPLLASPPVSGRSR